MSGNSGTQPSPQMNTKPAKTDRRILRTRDTLGGALVQLMHEKPFDDITVQEVLDRAGVSRTTFYTHYRDKDDLFLSDVEDFFELMSTFLTRGGAASKRVAPVEELLTHVSDVREFHQALVASGKMDDVRELGLGCFARSIEQRLLLAGVILDPASLRACSNALAGSLFAMLESWLRTGMTVPPSEMDALFHRLVWNGIGR
ncbi:MAG: TetR/AcrR family transcriptional regulator [Acidobacteriaceae bacterium]